MLDTELALEERGRLRQQQRIETELQKICGRVDAGQVVAGQLLQQEPRLGGAGRLGEPRGSAGASTAAEPARRRLRIAAAVAWRLRRSARHRLADSRRRPSHVLGPVPFSLEGIGREHDAPAPLVRRRSPVQSTSAPPIQSRPSVSRRPRGSSSPVTASEARTICSAALRRMLPRQRAERLARADFQQHVARVLQQLGDAVGKPHGVADVTGPVLRRLRLGRRDPLRRHVRTYGIVRFTEVHLAQRAR